MILEIQIKKKLEHEEDDDDHVHAIKQKRVSQLDEKPVNQKPARRKFANEEVEKVPLTSSQILAGVAKKSTTTTSTKESLNDSISLSSSISFVEETA